MNAEETNLALLGALIAVAVVLLVIVILVVVVAIAFVRFAGGFRRFDAHRENGEIVTSGRFEDWRQPIAVAAQEPTP